MNIKNCCCGIFSLRTGTVIFAALSLVASISGIFTIHSWPADVAYILYGLLAAFGIYAARVNDAKLVTCYFWILTATYLLQLLVLLVVAILGHGLLLDGYCKELIGFQREECEKMVKAQLRGIVASAFISQLMVMTWNLLIAHGYKKVLEAGGTGDEFASAESFGVNKRLIEPQAV